MNIKRSMNLLERAHRLIPGGTQTISKRPERYVPGCWPGYFDSAFGSHIRDVDGNDYLDYVLALGPILLGYNEPYVAEAVRRQLDKGTIATLQTPLEVEVAEKLVEHIPCAEMVRYFKTGAEATSAAVRIARAATGRETILSSGYAGCHDWWAAKNTIPNCARGVPKCLRDLIHDIPIGDIETLERLATAHSADLACIVIEPKAVEGMTPFLQAASDIASRFGAIFILDEVVTGFRMGLGGAQEYFGVTPDVATFGKAIANGFPLAAVVGRRDVMEIAADLWLTTTFGGEALSLAAAKATIHQLEETDALSRAWVAGARLMNGWRSLGLDNGRAEVYGLDPCPGLRFLGEDGEEESKLDARYVARMLERGILMRPSHCAFVTAAHTDDDIDQTVEATSAAIQGESLTVA